MNVQAAKTKKKEKKKLTINKKKNYTGDCVDQYKLSL